MRSLHMTRGAGLDGMAFRDHDVPSPRAYEALVRVRAVSLNNRELSIAIRGVYPLPVKRDVVAVSDGAGEVVAVGTGVTRVAVGDRVVASIFPQWLDGPFSLDRAAQLGGSLDGMLTEYAVLNEDALLLAPAHLGFEEAATLPCAGVTAWNALTAGAGLRAGQDVLTLGSGGVSLFAIQLAKLAGARVIATTSSAAKAERLLALGADHVIDYGATPEWDREVRRWTRDRGVDHVVEVGGAATLERSLRSVAMGGEVAFVGSLAGPQALIDANAIFLSGACVRAVAVGSRAQFAQLLRAIESGGLRPVIDRVFELEEARDAFEYYSAGRAFGKVVIRLGDTASASKVNA